jgi:hypothetical protein
MTKTRRNVSLDVDASSSLDRQIAAGGEASRYLEGLLALADADRLRALAAVREAGWRPSEIGAALQLVGSESADWRCYRSPASLASEMAMVGAPEAYRRSYVEQIGCDLRTWDARCTAVAQDPELARAVELLARLWAADDAELSKAVAG